MLSHHIRYFELFSLPWMLMHFIDLAGWFFFIVNVVGLTVLFVMSDFFIDEIEVESLLSMLVLSLYKGGSLMFFFDVNFWG
jgi:hypothetical protein